MLSSPWARLAVRAVLAGAVAALSVVQASDEPLATTTLWSALVAAAWAAVEILTPVNQSVGRSAR